MSTESRKRQLENSRKALWHLHLPLCLSLPDTVAILKMVACGPVWDPGIWFWMEQSRPYSQIIVSILTCWLPEELMRGSCLCFAWLQTHSGQKSSEHCSKIFSGKQKICSHIGQKIMVETCKHSLKPGKTSWGQSFFEKSGHSKAPMCTEEFRKPQACSGQDMC